MSDILDLVSVGIFRQETFSYKVTRYNCPLLGARIMIFGCFCILKVMVSVKLSLCVLWSM